MFWTELCKGNLKRETGSLLIAAQIVTLRTNYVQARIDKTGMLGRGERERERERER